MTNFRASKDWAAIKLLRNGQTVKYIRASAKQNISDARFDPFAGQIMICPLNDHYAVTISLGILGSRIFVVIEAVNQLSCAWSDSK